MLCARLTDGIEVFERTVFCDHDTMRLANIEAREHSGGNVEWGKDASNAELLAEFDEAAQDYGAAKEAWNGQDFVDAENRYNIASQAIVRRFQLIASHLESATVGGECYV